MDYSASLPFADWAVQYSKSELVQGRADAGLEELQPLVEVPSYLLLLRETLGLNYGLKTWWRRDGELRIWRYWHLDQQP